MRFVVTRCSGVLAVFAGLRVAAAGLGLMAAPGLKGGAAASGTTVPPPGVVIVAPNGGAPRRTTPAPRPRASAPPPEVAFTKTEQVFQPYRVQSATLAPDGKKVAFIVAGTQGAEVQIYTTGETPGKFATVVPPSDASPVRIWWISSRQLLALARNGTMTLIDGGLPTPVDISRVMQRDGADAKLPASSRIFPRPGDPTSVLIAFLASGKSDIAARPQLLELHRLNILTGETERVLDYPVESASRPEDLIVDQQGEPRLMFRRGAAPAFFAYRSNGEKFSALRQAAGLIYGDYGDWVELDSALPDPQIFRFDAGPGALLGESTIPLGFGSDRNLLYYASNVGRDTYGLYAADLRTKTRTDFAAELPGIDLVETEAPWQDSPLVFDRARQALAGVRLRGLTVTTRWLDEELGRVQAEIEEQLPDREVQILEWDEERSHFLALAGGLSDPGRYFVYDRARNLAIEYLKRAATGTYAASNPSEPFAFISPQGVRITGYLTHPRQPPAKGAPALVVALHGALVGPWDRVAPEYDRDAQALATMGFRVVKINYRGSTGFGIAHRDAIMDALDTAPLDDVVATLDWLRTERRIDTRRAGLLGEGYGGYLALRGLQLHPSRFRSAVAINAPTGPLRMATAREQGEPFQPPPFGPNGELPRAGVGGWQGKPNAPAGTNLLHRLVSRLPVLGSIDVSSHLELFTQPVFLLHDPARTNEPFAHIDDLRDELTRRGHPPEWMPLSRSFASPTSPEHAAAYGRIGTFFNFTLFTYGVQIGELELQPDEGTPARK